MDRDGDRLLAAQEGALRDLVHLVHPALVLPADEAADHLAVDGVYEPVERVPGPFVVASVVEVSAWKYAVLDEEATDELPCARLWQGVERPVGHRRCDSEFLQEPGYVLLADPGETAVGSLHRLQRVGQRHELGRDRSRGRVHEKAIHRRCEGAAPALPASVELVFCSAEPAIDVELDA